MPGGGEASHVDPDLGEDDLSGAPVHTRDRAKQGQQRGERGDHLGDLTAQSLDRLVQVVQVCQQLGHQQPVVTRDPPLESFPQRRQLVTQTAPGQLGQDLGIGGPTDQRLQHRPARDPQHIRGHTAQLDPGVLQHLVQPLGLASALLNASCEWLRVLVETGHGQVS
jgi:hypothetical protein